MEGDLLAYHLAQAEHHIAEGESDLVWLRQFIADLKAAELDPRIAEQVLQSCFETQAVYVARRDNLLAEVVKPADRKGARRSPPLS